MAIHGIKTRQILRKAIDMRERFHVGNLSGSMYRSWREVPTGRMSQDVENAFDRNLTGKTYVFVIFSYGTPIAVHDGFDWYNNTEKYSVTTTGHQNKIRTMQDNPGWL